MGLGEVFSSTWADYKKNFWTNTKIMLVFYLLPMLIILAIGIYMFYSTGLDKEAANVFQKIVAMQGASGNIDVERFGLSGVELQAQIMQNPEVLQLQAELSKSFLNFFVKAIWIILILGIIAGFASVYGMLAVFAPALKKKGSYGFKEALRETKPYYWRFVGLMLLIYLIMSVGMIVGAILGILTFGLGILAAVIALIWLFILWAFAPYIIVDMNKGVFASMKESKKIVKGKWWRTFGYLLLIGLIFAVVYWVISSIFNMILGAVFFSGMSSIGQQLLVGGTIDVNIINELINTLVIYGSISMIISSVISIIAMPYLLLFGKNMYQSFRRERKQ